MAIEQAEDNVEKNDEQLLRVKVERLSDNVLAISVHESQLLKVMTSLQANGIEPYRCVDNDTQSGEYELLYIASENPEVDAIRYQAILDNAA